ncbi:hypothetical protein NP493_418g00000 [Ridgeia piscesae]|uniref:Transporter n=1 Tax=Ridgeia piscesae TaxID=27915 RepID=A0AAD9NSP2_RIDPI|nr:hypothetical protein NP493_418g00000 [Ridgeia piscesae]
MYFHVFQTDLPVLLHRPPRPVVGLYAAVACFYQADDTAMIPKSVGEASCMDKDFSLSTNSEDENVERGNWTGKLDFLLSCLSYAVGLGNLWRFPYLCYRNGGGAFLIPYVFMLVFAGIPLFFMELSFGQFASEGVITVWKVCPLLQGIGWGMFIVSSFIAVYYNVVIAWSIFYLLASLNTQVPWSTCDNHWNTPECGIVNLAEKHNCTLHNGTWRNHTCYIVTGRDHDKFNVNISNGYTHMEMLASRKSPSDEYFHNFVLDISEGFHEMGGVRWQLAGCLLLAWMLVGGCLIKGIKSQGKVVYFTATFPYLVLCVLLVRGITLDGSGDGILYYITPQWNRLANAKVWGDAAVQIFFSLSPCWGGLITLASYNKFHNNCLRDSLFVAIGNCLTSVFAGFVIFAIIGFIAHEIGVGVDEVAKGGAGLAFIIYPEVVSRLPISPLWAILFFSMLVTLGLGTQFSVVTTLHTTLLDVFPNTLRHGKRPMLVMICICLIGYLLGLSCCTRGGMYMLQLIDNYAATYSVLIIGLCECLALSYVYGIDAFLKDIEMMLGYKPHIWWKIMWKYVTPLILVFIMVFTWVDFVPSSYGEYTFPLWAEVVGWIMSMTSVSAIPIFIAWKVCTAEQEDTLWETIKRLSQPTADWGPSLEKHRQIAQSHETNIPLNPAPTSIHIEIDPSS